jgi:hypothetical protein
VPTTRPGGLSTGQARWNPAFSTVSTDLPPNSPGLAERLLKSGSSGPGVRVVCGRRPELLLGEPRRLAIARHRALTLFKTRDYNRAALRPSGAYDR